MPQENANPFSEYLEKLRELEAQIKLAAFHAQEAAELCKRASDYSLLAVYYVRKVLNGK